MYPKIIENSLLPLKCDLCFQNLKTLAKAFGAKYLPIFLFFQPQIWIRMKPFKFFHLWQAKWWRPQLRWPGAPQWQRRIFTANQLTLIRQPDTSRPPSFTKTSSIQCGENNQATNQLNTQPTEQLSFIRHTRETGFRAPSLTKDHLGRKWCESIPAFLSEFCFKGILMTSPSDWEAPIWSSCQIVGQLKTSHSRPLLLMMRHRGKQRISEWCAEQIKTKSIRKTKFSSV